MFYQCLFADEIMVTGLLYAKWRTPVMDARCDLELMLQANHIRQVLILVCSCL